MYYDSNYSNEGGSALSKFLTTNTYTKPNSHQKMSSRKEKSDRESSPESDDEGGNTFANDGSFLEMFKRRMEEQKRQEKTKSELGGAGHASTGKSSTAKTITSATKPSLSSSTEVPKASVNKPYQVVQNFSMNHIKIIVLIDLM